MKNLVLTSIAALALQVSFAGEPIANKAQTFRTIKHQAFKAGEKLRYRIHYGVIDAGEATLEIKATDKKVKGRSLLHMVGNGKSLGSFDWFFKVRDRYETYVDKQGVFPWMFVRRVDEGGYITNQDYIFRQDSELVDNGEGKKIEAPFGIQDMLSSFYYARTIDFKNASKNQEFAVKMFIDNEVYPLKIKYLGDEVIKTRKGKFNCHMIRPIVMKGRIWKEEEDVTMWVTADENKVPVEMKSEIQVGSIKATLVEWEGLANPISKL